MKSAASSYALVLLTIPGAADAVPEVRAAFQSCPELGIALGDPTIPESEKFVVIDRLFPEALRTYLKVICRSGEMDNLLEIFSEYEAFERQQRQCASAVLEYVTPLTETQLSRMRKWICEKTGKQEVYLELRQNPALLGGFVLRIGDETYDRSVRAAVKHMRNSLIRR